MEKESSISWSGTLMLVLLLVSGPLVYLFAFLVSSVRKRSSGRSKPETSKESEGLNTAGREQWSTSQYLFGLIGYAIGIGNVWRFAYVIAKGVCSVCVCVCVRARLRTGVVICR